MHHTSAITPATSLLIPAHLFRVKSPAKLTFDIWFSLFIHSRCALSSRSDAFRIIFPPLSSSLPHNLKRRTFIIIVIITCANCYFHLSLSRRTSVGFPPSLSIHRTLLSTRPSAFQVLEVSDLGRRTAIRRMCTNRLDMDAQTTQLSHAHICLNPHSTLNMSMIM